MKKYFITGGEGFIGKHLVKMLHNDPTNEVEVYKGDVTFNISRQNHYDVVYHLAANTDTTYANDIGMYLNNVIGFLKVLDFAKKNKSKLVYASSGAVYGNANSGPLNAYAHSKFVIDDIAKRFFDRLDIVGLRFFNVYGQGEEPKKKSASMITQWKNQIRKGEQPKIFSGVFKRDFVYVKDVVESLIIGAQVLDSGIYDVGIGRSTDFNEVLQIIIEELGAKVEPIQIPNPYLEKYQVHTLANIKWGFKPKYSIRQGIRDYFNEEGFKKMGS